MTHLLCRVRIEELFENPVFFISFQYIADNKSLSHAITTNGVLTPVRLAHLHNNT